MMKYKNWILILVAIVLVQLGLTFGVYSYLQKGNRTGYIVAAEVFDQFEYTKEVRKQLKNDQASMVRIIDSLRTTLDLNPPQDANDIRVIRLNELSEKLNDRSETMAQEYNNRIWTRINQYTREYGAQKGYKYIFGANGAGLLMHADSTANITTDVVKFINERYTDVH